MHVKWQAHVEWPVHVKQQVQVQCHVVVDVNGIRGMVVDVVLLAMGMEQNGTVGFCGGFGHVGWWAHIEWQYWGWVCGVVVGFLNGPGRVHCQILHNHNKNVSYERLKQGKQKSLLSSGRYTPEQTHKAILPTPNLLRLWYYGPIPKVSLMCVDVLRSCG